MNDFERIARLVDMHNALSRLSPEQLQALDTEVAWVQAQKAKGRIPSPETLVARAPIYLRVLAMIGDGDDL